MGQGASGLQGGLRTWAGRRGKSENRLAAYAAQTGRARGLEHGFLKKIHIHAGRGAGTQHFRIAQQAAQAHDFRGELGLHRKDALLQPVHERHVVGQAAQKGHGRVGMSIDEAGQNEHPAQIKLALGLPGGAQRVTRPHGSHQPVGDGHGCVFKDAALRVLSDDDSGVEERVAVLHEKSRV